MTISEFKQNVSIIEFINSRPDLDFIFKKDGKNYKAFIPKRDNEGKIVYQDNKPLKKEQIIISRINLNDSSGKYQSEFYVNDFNFERNKSKSIIDFVHDFVIAKNTSQKMDMRKILGVLSEYVKSENFINIENSSYDFQTTKTNNPSRNKNKKIDYSFPTKKTFEYLNSRKINHDTITKFLGTFGTYSDSENHIHEKPAFPYSKNSKIVTAQWIDYNSETMTHREKYYAADLQKNDALWNSNHLNENNTLIAVESPEKAMAHYQLFNKDMNRDNVNPYYLSAGGNLTASCIDHMLEQKEKFNLEKTVLAFDPDTAGHVYTIKFILQQEKLEFNIKPTVNDKNDKIIELTFKNSEDATIANKFFKNSIFKKDSNSLIIQDDIKNLIPPKNTQIHSSEFLDDLKNNNYFPHNFKNSTKIQSTNI